MLWQTYPKYLDEWTLDAAYQSLRGDPPAKIPFTVWLLENPASPLAMPGNIDLIGHDCMHLLLKQGFAASNEAFVVGFTMGNDLRTNWLHLLIFRIAAFFLYPPKYRLTWAELTIFDRGVALGRQAQVKNLNRLNLAQWHGKTLAAIRAEIGLPI
jgi:hypothetical protein